MERQLSNQGGPPGNGRRAHQNGRAKYAQPKHPQNRKHSFQSGMLWYKVEVPFAFLPQGYPSNAQYVLGSSGYYRNDGSAMSYPYPAAYNYQGQVGYYAPQQQQPPTFHQQQTYPQHQQQHPQNTQQRENPIYDDHHRIVANADPTVPHQQQADVSNNSPDKKKFATTETQTGEELLLPLVQKLAGSMYGKTAPVANRDGPKQETTPKKATESPVSCNSSDEPVSGSRKSDEQDALNALSSTPSLTKQEPESSDVSTQPLKKSEVTEKADQSKSTHAAPTSRKVPTQPLQLECKPMPSDPKIRNSNPQVTATAPNTPIGTNQINTCFDYINDFPLLSSAENKAAEHTVVLSKTLKKKMKKEKREEEKADKAETDAPAAPFVDQHVSTPSQAAKKANTQKTFKEDRMQHRKEDFKQDTRKSESSSSGSEKKEQREKKEFKQAKQVQGSLSKPAKPGVVAAIQKEVANGSLQAADNEAKHPKRLSKAQRNKLKKERESKMKLDQDLALALIPVDNSPATSSETTKEDSTHSGLPQRNPDNVPTLPPIQSAKKIFNFNKKHIATIQTLINETQTIFDEKREKFNAHLVSLGFAEKKKYGNIVFLRGPLIKQPSKNEKAKKDKEEAEKLKEQPAKQHSSAERLPEPVPPQQVVDASEVTSDTEGNRSLTNGSSEPIEQSADEVMFLEFSNLFDVEVVGNGKSYSRKRQEAKKERNKMYLDMRKPLDVFTEKSVLEWLIDNNRLDAVPPEGIRKIEDLKTRKLAWRLQSTAVWLKFYETVMVNFRSKGLSFNVPPSTIDHSFYSIGDKLADNLEENPYKGLWIEDDLKTSERFLDGRIRFYEAAEKNQINRKLLMFFQMIRKLFSNSLIQDMSCLARMNLTESNQVVQDKEYFENVSLCVTNFFDRSVAPITVNVPFIRRVIATTISDQHLAHFSEYVSQQWLVRETRVNIDKLENLKTFATLFYRCYRNPIGRERCSLKTAQTTFRVFKAQLEQQEDTKEMASFFEFLLNIRSSIITADLFSFRNRCINFSYNNQKMILFLLKLWFGYQIESKPVKLHLVNPSKYAIRPKFVLDFEIR